MTYQLNRDKTILHDYLSMTAHLVLPQEPDDGPQRPEINERIELVRRELADLVEVVSNYRIGERYLFFALIRDLPDVTTPTDYLTTAREYLENLDVTEYLDKLCQSLELTCVKHDLTSVKAMLTSSYLSDQEKWQVLTLFSDPRAYLRHMIDTLEVVFSRLEPIYADIVVSEEKQLRHMTDDQLISDMKLVEQTFTQDMSAFERCEIVPVLFHPYTAVLFPQGNALMVSLGTSLGDSLRNQDKMDSKQKTEFFKNLSDPTRYDMLKLLATSDYSNKYLAETLGVTAPNISYHLRTLLKDGLVKLDLERDRTTYRINQDYFHQMIAALEADMGLKHRG